ncbi:hypothetical protein JYG53_24525, partial [Escherichia fergusonii]|nr:hypothetical protein [Escherichia fergusonii]
MEQTIVRVNARIVFIEITRKILIDQAVFDEFVGVFAFKPVKITEQETVIETIRGNIQQAFTRRIGLYGQLFCNFF